MKRTTLQSVNKERFAFMFASLVGRKVTVKLRNLTSYEGVFSGCNLDKGEYTVLLQFAHELPSENRLSGPVQDPMLIPGKEVVMMSGIDVPEEGLEAKLIDDRAGEFKTDVDITTKQRFSARGERHLQSWADLQEDAGHDLELDSHSAGWSNPNHQFTVANQMGVVSTYKEELYTTPLDYTRLSSEQRTRAEKLAREIEGGRNYSSQEEGADHADEEARFSAVIGTGGYKKGAPTGPPAGPAHPSTTASSWRRMDDDSMSRSGVNTRLNALNLEPASARAAPAPPQEAPKPKAATTLPQIPPRPTTPSTPAVVSEMKGINALNLEPASVSSRAGAAGYKGAAARQPAQPTKRDFEIALAEIKSREQRNTNGGSTTLPAVERTIPGKGKGKGVITTSSPTSKSAAAPSKFSFNPNASTFTPGGAAPGATAAAGGNTLSIAITPGGSLSGTLKSSNYEYFEGAPAGVAPPAAGAAPQAPQPPPPMATMPIHPGMMGPPPMMMFPPPHMVGGQFGMMVPPPPQPMGPPPQFSPLVESAQMDKMTVPELLSKFTDKAGSTPSTSSSFEWASEPGPSYKEILGPLPQGGPPHPMMAPPMMGGAPGAFPMMPQAMMMAPGYGVPAPYPPYYPSRGQRGGPPPAGQFMPQYPGGYMAVPPPHGGYRGGPYRGPGSGQGSTPPSQNTSTPPDQ